MTRTQSVVLSHKSQATLTSTVTLAFWRSRQTWPLLLITSIGLITAVTLACLVPLLSAVMMTAGLHDVLNADPSNAALTLNASTLGISTRMATAVQQQLDSAVYKQLRPYLRAYTESSLEVDNLDLLNMPNAGWPAKPYTLRMYSLSMQQASSHVQLLQGRLPKDALVNGEVETVLHPDEAADFHASIGDSFTIEVRPSFQPRDDIGNPLPFRQPLIKVRVVGIFKAKSPAETIWQGNDFQPYESKSVDHFSLFTPLHAMLQAADEQHLEFGPTSPSPIYSLFALGHTYYLNTSALKIGQLDTLMERLRSLQNDLSNTYGNIEGQENPTGDVVSRFPYIDLFSLVGSVFDYHATPSILENYSNRLAVARLPVILLTLQVVALMLYFVSMMADLLVEQQRNALAVIRSRGGSGFQVFAALLTQCAFLVLFALVVGPCLALLLAAFIGRLVLAPTELSALQAILSAPLAALWETRWYALGVAVVALAAMSISLFRVARMDVLSSRREASRSLLRPFWQRFYLDVIAGVIALLGYGFSLYLTNVGSLLDARSQTLLLVPLSLVTPLFLVLACLLLFLRLFPFLLRSAAWVAVRGRGAASMLALAQMARSPRQSVRMTMLLALAIAFTLFTLIFSASQQQRVTDLANYESGADFRGTRSSQASPLSLMDAHALYGHLPGVLSVTPGWNAIGYPMAKGAGLSIAFRAVDAESFASTAYWPVQVGGEPLPKLLQLLISLRPTSQQKNTVPVIIDATMRDRMKLHIGSIFQVDTQDLRFDLNYQVVGMITHMPTVNDTTDVANASSSDALPEGGMLMDYQTLSGVYQQNIALLGLTNDLVVNQVWLHTSDDQSSLLQLRQVLQDPSYSLDNLYDRRLLLKNLGNDPLHVNLTSILLVGVSAALFLALLGDLLISWFNARSRLTNFAVLRALGTGPGQVASVFMWEQIIVYLSALFLGSLFGSLFAFTVVPVLLFNSQPTQGNLSMLSSDEMYALQQVIPTHIVVPQSLGIAFALLVLICALALGLMVRIVARPSLAQTLRLNED